MKSALVKLIAIAFVASFSVVGAQAKDVSSSYIKSGLSPTKSAQDRADWWKENMAYKCRRVLGRVVGEPGRQSRIVLDIGSDVTVSCLIRPHEVVKAKKLKPGKKIFCLGTIASTWKQGSRVSFEIDATVGKAKN